MTTRAITHRTVLVTGGALLVLWIVSWAVSYAPFGPWSIPIALGIAGMKALLVALFFMELLRESASFNLAIITAAALIAVFVSLVVIDVVTRGVVPFVPTRPQTSEAAFP